MASQSYYDILGVSCTASPTEIKRAYNSLALQTHPDKLLHSTPNSSSSSSSSSYNSNSNSNPDSDPDSEPVESVSECTNIKATKKPKPNITFHMIHLAYKTLIDSTSRRKYDAQISAFGSMGTPHVVIDLDDMVYSVTNSDSRKEDTELKSGEGSDDMVYSNTNRNSQNGEGGEGGGNGVYGYPCRCGDDITISEDELERGVEIVECTGCSLRAKIVYFVVED